MSKFMLYDLDTDREETVNISENSANKKLVEQLSDKLKKYIGKRDKILIPQFIVVTKNN